MKTKWRILLIHNYYKSTAPSGEDVVYKSERELLERSGHTVIVYERFNDLIKDEGFLQRVALGLETVWAKEAYKDLKKLIALHRPDVAHFHNTFPQISPSAYSACFEEGVPVLQTLHNYRLICPGGLLLRDSSPCEKCVGRSLLPALRHRCYRQSLPATAALVSMITLHRLRGTYNRDVSRYLSLTEFAASKMIEGGLPSSKVIVKPNFLLDTPPIGTGKGGHALFVGRLSAEKGVTTLLNAWRQLPDFQLKIAGQGELLEDIQQIVTAENLPVELLGQLSKEEVTAAMRDAAFLIVPSECYEGFPMVVVESFASGTPVLAADIGSLSEVVFEDIGCKKFAPGNVAQLVSGVREMFQAHEEAGPRRTLVRDHYLKNFTPEIGLRNLLDAYAQASSSAAQDVS
ncbi:MAG: glycosyltransferase [Gammaproteobacteria bacterium]|nr:glycosyltransferase [Gammaproteobacteria bacterium]